jgi:hypothetical protein
MNANEALVVDRPVSGPCRFLFRWHEDSASEVVPVVVDGEAGCARDLREQRAREVIERRPEVVHDVTDDDAHLGGRRLVHEHAYEEAVAFQVQLAPKFMGWFRSPRSHHRAQFLQMLVSPYELGAEVSQR